MGKRCGQAPMPFMAKTSNGTKKPKSARAKQLSLTMKGLRMLKAPAVAQCHIHPEFDKMAQLSIFEMVQVRFVLFGAKGFYIGLD